KILSSENQSSITTPSKMRLDAPGRKTVDDEKWSSEIKKCSNDELKHIVMLAFGEFLRRENDLKCNSDLLQDKDLKLVATKLSLKSPSTRRKILNLLFK